MTESELGRSHSSRSLVVADSEVVVKFQSSATRKAIEVEMRDEVKGVVVSEEGGWCR